MQLGDDDGVRLRTKLRLDDEVVRPGRDVVYIEIDDRLPGPEQTVIVRADQMTFRCLKLEGRRENRRCVDDDAHGWPGSGRRRERCRVHRHDWGNGIGRANGRCGERRSRDQEGEGEE